MNPLHFTSDVSILFKFGNNELMNLLSKSELTSNSLLSERNFQKMSF
jgi:hypothetical protein